MNIVNESICEFVQVINEMQISRDVAHDNGTAYCCLGLDAVFSGDNNYPSLGGASSPSKQDVLR